MNVLLSIIASGNVEPARLPGLAVERIRRAGTIFYDNDATRRLAEQLRRGDAELQALDRTASDHTIRERWTRAASDHPYLVHLLWGDFGTMREPRGGLPEPGETGLRYELISSPGLLSRLATFGEIAPLQQTDGCFGVVDARNGSDPNGGPDWERLAQLDTLVILATPGTEPAPVRHLIEAGRSPDSPAFVFENGGEPDQETRRVALQQLVDGPRNSKNRDRDLVIVSARSVPSSDRKSWFERRPLYGRRILVTRPEAGKDRLAHMLREQGANVDHIPTIAIQPLNEGLATLKNTVEDLSSYNWLVFTSRNGVRFFFDVLRQRDLDARSLGSLGLACIGKGTADQLTRYGLRADLVPEEYRAEALVEVLDRAAEDGSSFLLPRASGARPVLPDRLEELGHRVREIPIYRASPPEQSKQPLREAIDSSRIDMITFTSSSTVDSLFNLIDDQDSLTRWMNRIDCSAIGPITATTLREYGVDVDLIPDQFDFPHYARSIVRFYSDAEPIPIDEGDPL